MNMYMPVGSSALETAFQLAITVNFCLAVSGSRGSVAAGGGGGDEPSFPAWLRDLVVASLLNSQPMLRPSPQGIRTPHVAEDTSQVTHNGVWSLPRVPKPANRAAALRALSIPMLLPLPATSVEIYIGASAEPRERTTLRSMCTYVYCKLLSRWYEKRWFSFKSWIKSAVKRRFALTIRYLNPLSFFAR